MSSRSKDRRKPSECCCDSQTPFQKDAASLDTFVPNMKSLPRNNSLRGPVKASTRLAAKTGSDWLRKLNKAESCLPQIHFQRSAFLTRHSLFALAVIWPALSEMSSSLSSTLHFDASESPRSLPTWTPNFLPVHLNHRGDRWSC